MKHNRKLVSLFLLVLSLFALSLAAAAADNVVFLATGGTGDGSSPDAPIGRLTAAMDALDLSRDDATVVLVGEFKQTTFFAYTEEFSGTVTITAVYDGVDYRTQGAKYTVSGQRFMCAGAYVFRDLDFHLLDNYFFVIANHYPVTIDTGVTITSDGAKFDGNSFASAFAICGGYQAGQAMTSGGAKPQASGSDPVEITVRSGEGITIAAYSRGFANSDFSGAATVTVEGDAKIGTLYIAPINGVSAGNTDTTLNLGGNAHIERLVCSDKPISMQRFVLNWTGGTLGAFDRKPEDKSAEGFALHYSAAVGKTISFGVVGSSFDTLNKKGGFAPTRTYAGQFADVASHWSLEYVKTAYEYGLANRIRVLARGDVHGRAGADRGGQHPHRVQRHKGSCGSGGRGMVHALRRILHRERHHQGWAVHRLQQEHYARRDGDRLCKHPARERIQGDPHLHALRYGRHAALRGGREEACRGGHRRRRGRQVQPAE